MSIFSDTVCDKGTYFLRNRSSDNIESNTKTLFNENETRLLRKIVMVFNAPFNNISIISWQSVLLVEETGVPGENHRPARSH